MHDHSLGGPYSIGVQPHALHSGPCFDGVYGCHLCWNAANDGKGTVDECDRCGKETFTRVTKAFDENASYAWCEECRDAVRASVEREEEELDRLRALSPDEPEDAWDDYDDEAIDWETSPDPVRDPLEGSVDVEVVLTDDELKY